MGNGIISTNTKTKTKIEIIHSNESLKSISISYTKSENELDIMDNIIDNRPNISIDIEKIRDEDLIIDLTQRNNTLQNENILLKVKNKSLTNMINRKNDKIEDLNKKLIINKKNFKSILNNSPVKFKNYINDSMGVVKSHGFKNIESKDDILLSLVSIKGPGDYSKKGKSCSNLFKY